MVSDDFIKALKGRSSVGAAVDTVVMPIGGRGTRVLPATKAIPKHFLMVGDQPLIQHAVDEARKAGIKRFVFVIDDDPASLSMLQRQFFGSEDLNGYLLARKMSAQLKAVKASDLSKEQVYFAVQSHPNGMWSALEAARPYIEGSAFAVMCPDDLLLPVTSGLPEMVRAYRSDQDIFVGVEKVLPEDIHKFGIINPGVSGRSKTVRVESIVEKPLPENAPSDYAIIGRYILPTRIFDLFSPDMVQDKNAEVGLAHAIHTLCRTVPVVAVKTVGKRYDCGSKAGLARANLRVFMEDMKVSEALETEWRDIQTARQKNRKFPKP